MIERAQTVPVEPDALSTTRLSTVETTLQHYLAGFGVMDVAIEPLQREQPDAAPVRPAISDTVLLLPECYFAHEAGTGASIYRAAISHALAHLFHSPRYCPVGTRKPMLIAVISLLEDARVERLMARSYPGLHALWGRFHVASEVDGLGFGALAARLARALHNAEYTDGNYWVDKGRKLFEGCVESLEDPAPFEEIAKILANDLGQMRVRFEAQQYRVEPAYRDDNTFLWHFEAHDPASPEDPELARESVRVEPADADAGRAMHIQPVPIEERRRFSYNEWDYRIEREREAWATLTEHGGAPASPTAPGATQHRLSRRGRLLHAAPARQVDRAVRLRRQHEGDELDLNAAIEGRISQRARIAPDPRVFQRAGRRRRHLAILLLLDLSESTNDRVGSGSTTVLDIEKRAAALVAESVDAAHDRVALHGFASDGRHDVRYIEIKDFGEPYGELQRRRLDQQRGALSTRVGAALRHAASRLAGERAEKKILLVLTDGEPSDIDVYDSRYLVEDARHAVAGLAHRGIDTFCLTLDKQADAYVRAIFGAWGYLIVDDPALLPSQLAGVLARVAAR